MDNSRLLLWLSFGLVCFLLWEAWVQDYQRAPAAPAGVSSTETATTDTMAQDDLPLLGDIDDAPASDETQATEPAPGTEVSAMARRVPIQVRTDLLDVEIDPLGGELISARLPAYPVHKDAPDIPIQLLNRDTSQSYVLQSGLLSRESPAPDHRALFTSAKSVYELGPGQDELDVVLMWQEDGVTATKTFTFRRGSYRVDLKQELTTTAEPWRGAAYVQIKRKKEPPDRSFFDVDSYSFIGPLFFDGEKYEKLKLKDLQKRPLQASVTGGWIASVQHHFVTAAVPARDVTVQYRSRLQDGDVALLSAVNSAQSVAPGATAEFRHTLFLGPKLQDELAAIAPKLNKVVDYGFLAILSEPLFWLLKKIHSFVGNWGWSIILLTILIKLVFYKLTETSGRSMAKMRKLQPRLKALQERYKDDRQQLSQSMMELYKREGANPMAGCLPILVQMPVFLALYWVLIESVELRQAPWALWINDLSVRDPYFILPLLMGITMVAQQKLNPAPPDPIQARVATILPIVMTVFFAFFPAGLVLYWFVNTLLSVAQQWHINRVIERE